MGAGAGSEAGYTLISANRNLSSQGTLDILWRKWTLWGVELAHLMLTSLLGLVFCALHHHKVTHQSNCVVLILPWFFNHLLTLDLCFGSLRLPSPKLSGMSGSRKAPFSSNQFAPTTPMESSLVLPIFSCLWRWRGRFNVTSYIMNQWHQLLKPKVFVRSSFKNTEDLTTFTLPFKLISEGDGRFKVKSGLFSSVYLQMHKAGSVMSCLKGHLFVQLYASLHRTPMKSQLIFLL